VCPAYNEAKILPKLIKRISDVMKNLNFEWEVLIINDASTDNSADVLRKLQKRYKQLRPITHTKNRGQTGCFSSGFQNATGDIVITMDSDLEVDPEDIPLFLQKLKGEVDVVNGIRTNRKHTFAINFASRMYNMLVFLFFKTQTYDSASNFTAFRAKFVKGLKLCHNDHRYILPIVQRRGAHEIDEVIIHHHRREAGRSKYTAIKKFFYGFLEIIYAWFRIIVLRQYDIRKS
jgi:glycosyltransferase involved in cell wall biosynthesis